MLAYRVWTSGTMEFIQLLMLIQTSVKHKMANIGGAANLCAACHFTAIYENRSSYIIAWKALPLISGSFRKSNQVLILDALWIGCLTGKLRRWVNLAETLALPRLIHLTHSKYSRNSSHDTVFMNSESNGGYFVSQNRFHCDIWYFHLFRSRNVNPFDLTVGRWLNLDPEHSWKCSRYIWSFCRLRQYSLCFLIPELTFSLPTEHSSHNSQSSM